MSEESIRIPVGYLTKLVTEVNRGDVVRNFGKILSIKNVRNYIFTDEELGIDYISDAIQLKTKSVLTGRMLYELIPVGEEVEVLMYEFINTTT